MSCWKLAQWKLGPSVTENVELFAAIALRTTCELRLQYDDIDLFENYDAPLQVYEIIAMGLPPSGKYRTSNKEQTLKQR